MDPCLGTAKPPGPFAYTGDRTAFFQKGYCGIMTTNMHELGHLMGLASNETTRSVRTSREPSDTVSGKSGSQLLLQWTEVRIVGLDGREEEGGQHVIDRIRGSVGCLVDMKVDELLNDDMTFSKSALATI
jgi:hypothetical protein